MVPRRDWPRNGESGRRWRDADIPLSGVQRRIRPRDHRGEGLVRPCPRREGRLGTGSQTTVTLRVLRRRRSFGVNIGMGQMSEPDRPRRKSSCMPRRPRGAGPQHGPRHRPRRRHSRDGRCHRRRCQTPHSSIHKRRCRARRPHRPRRHRRLRRPHRPRRPRGPRGFGWQKVRHLLLTSSLLLQP